MVGTLVVLLGALIVTTVVVVGSLVVGWLLDRPLDADEMPTFGAITDTALLLVAIGAVIPVVLFAVWAIDRRPVGTVSSVVGRLRYGWLGVCLLVALPTVVLTIGLSIVALVLTDAGDAAEVGSWAGWGSLAASMAMLIVLVPFQAGAEEYVCRGWLLQAVGGLVRRPWLAIAPQAILFAAAHGWGTAWGFADLVFFGAVAGWLTIRTGGLEAAIGLHVMNNVIALGLAAAYGMLDSDQTAADSPWQVVVVDVVLLSLYAWVVLWLARRRRIATVTPAAEIAPPEPSPAPLAAQLVQ